MWFSVLLIWLQLPAKVPVIKSDSASDLPAAYRPPDLLNSGLLLPSAGLICPPTSLRHCRNQRWCFPSLKVLYIYIYIYIYIHTHAQNKKMNYKSDWEHYLLSPPCGLVWNWQHNTSSGLTTWTCSKQHACKSPLCAHLRYLMIWRESA